MTTTNKTVSAANREFKDTVFRAVFSQNEKILIELYNAIAGTHYSANTKVIVRTLTSVLRGGMKNDLAFELDGELIVLIEHQSTINANMPLRMLYYIVEIYSGFVEEKALYRSERIAIPYPKFIVLYNGVQRIEGGHQVLKLSDMFAKHGVENPVGNLELVVQVYDINEGSNPQMAERSPTLAGYETFVAITRKYKGKMSDEEAIMRAVDECIENGILKEFFTKYRQEIVIMLKNEWNYNLELEVREEEGRMDEKKETARKMLAKNKLSVDEIAEYTGLDVADIVMLQSKMVNS